MLIEKLTCTTAEVYVSGSSALPEKLGNGERVQGLRLLEVRKLHCITIEWLPFSHFPLPPSLVLSGKQRVASDFHHGRVTLRLTLPTCYALAGRYPNVDSGHWIDDRGTAQVFLFAYVYDGEGGANSSHVSGDSDRHLCAVEHPKHAIGVPAWCADGPSSVPRNIACVQLGEGAPHGEDRAVGSRAKAAEFQAGAWCCQIHAI